MGVEESRAVIRRFYGALQAGDWTAVADLHAETCVFRIFGRTPVSGEWRDKEAYFRDVFARLHAGQVEAGAGLRWRLVCAEGEWVVALVDAPAQTPESLAYPQHYGHLFRVRNGRIVDFLEWFDTALAEEFLFANPLRVPRPEPASPIDILTI